MEKYIRDTIFSTFFGITMGYAWHLGFEPLVIGILAVYIQFTWWRS